MANPQPSRPLIVAIDGPSGVGKGTVSRALARALGYRHVDTGAMYRAVAWKAQHDGLRVDDEADAGRRRAAMDLQIDEHGVVASTASTSRARFERRRWTPPRQRWRGCRACATSSSPASAKSGVRGGVVMEGRDIGTVVFPDADVKIYLDASPEERARRRAADPAHGGGGAPLTEVATALAARDQSDATRAASPLTIAPDAVLVDTTGCRLTRSSKVLTIVGR